MYERLLKEIAGQEIEVFEKKMPSKLKGLYGDNVILINKNIPTTIEKACILAEELGHHFTSIGNILDQKKIENIKQEKRARNWAYEKLVPLKSIIKAHRLGIQNRFELADYMDVTEEFLDSALKRYQEKYGLQVTYGKYTISFDPLGVIEQFD